MSEPLPVILSQKLTGRTRSLSVARVAAFGVVDDRAAAIDAGPGKTGVVEGVSPVIVSVVPRTRPPPSSPRRTIDGYSTSELTLIQFMVVESTCWSSATASS
jgi:hypothetical protein